MKLNNALKLQFSSEAVILSISRILCTDGRTPRRNETCVRNLTTWYWHKLRARPCSFLLGGMWRRHEKTKQKSHTLSSGELFVLNETRMRSLHSGQYRTGCLDTDCLWKLFLCSEARILLNIGNLRSRYVVETYVLQYQWKCSVIPTKYEVPGTQSRTGLSVLSGQAARTVLRRDKGIAARCSENLREAGSARIFLSKVNMFLVSETQHGFYMHSVIWSCENKKKKMLMLHLRGYEILETHSCIFVKLWWKSFIEHWLKSVSSFNFMQLLLRWNSRCLAQPVRLLSFPFIAITNEPFEFVMGMLLLYLAAWKHRGLFESIWDSLKQSPSRKASICLGRQEIQLPV